MTEELEIACLLEFVFICLALELLEHLFKRMLFCWKAVI